MEDFIISEQDIQRKIKLLLEKLIVARNSNKITPANASACFNRLLTLVKQRHEATIKTLTEWIMVAVPVWSLNKINPDEAIAGFALNLASELSIDEAKFNELNINGFFANAINIVGASNDQASSTIKLTYIKLVSNFLEHTSGICFVVCNSFWKDILSFSLDEEILVSSESWTLISKLLERTVDCYPMFCDEIVKEILLPLEENIFQFMIDSEQINDDIVESIVPVLQLAGNTLEYLLESALFFGKDLKVPLLFLKNFKLKRNFRNFIDQCNNRKLIFELSKLMFIIQFLEVYLHVLANKLTDAEIKCSLDKIIDSFNAVLKKGSLEDVAKFCNFGQLYWKIVNRKIPCAKNSANYGYQLLILQLVPFLGLKKYFCTIEYDDWYNLLKEDFRDAYRQKLYDIVDEKTIRVAYSWKNGFDDNLCLYQVVKTSVTYILKSRKYFEKEMSVIVLQNVIYKMSDLVTTMKTYPISIKKYVMAEDTIIAFLDATVIFIEEFDITWKDCIEINDVMAIAVDLLAVTDWSTRFVEKTLDLLNFAFDKFTCPNLALLVDKTSDCALDLIAPLVCLKVKDEDSCIRQKSLEIVHTMSKNASSKFPSLQKVLMDSDLPGLVVKMAIGDGESFVRATAIKCLQEMIQVEEIWNNSLKSQDLSGKMRQILINETEGIVRVEAATFMCISYENNQFPEETLERVYETMIHSSTTDLHWEVKVRALNFWDKVINNHLQHQGMIDGSFPSVTFSKEHRKIVTLTDAEIKKRLLKVLGQLSSIGCLGVLISAIRDDCDMEVSKTAVKITQKLVELLKKYNIHGDCSVPTSPQPTENGMSSSASISSGVSGDDCMSSPVTPANSDLNEEIINQIVNSRDVNLLQNVYTPSDYGSVLNYDLQVRTIVSPNEFLLFTQQDLNVIINEKKNWLNGIEDLGSLLDDMLKSYDDDVNSMDCY